MIIFATFGIVPIPYVLICKFMANMDTYLSFPCRNIARVAAAAVGVAAAAAARMSPRLKTGNGVVTIDTRAAQSSRRMLRPLPFLPLPSLGDRH
jgi:hypothetical protein